MGPEVKKPILTLIDWDWNGLVQQLALANRTLKENCKPPASRIKIADGYCKPNMELNKKISVTTPGDSEPQGSAIRND